ncbi:MAG: ATP-dependent DNA helicase [Candidatus Competibacteraceae bacterium]|nr:MAG: ATP-dependent DNA helicase [Candidatus Competibacteraceae bacterium]
MSLEGQQQDKKSLRAVTGKTADWHELVKDCVAFANATGGRIFIGIEDADYLPPVGQRIPEALPDTLRRRVNELTVNVSVAPAIEQASNGAEYIVLSVQRALATASTSDGRYYLRVADSSRPLVGDEVMRLMNERSALPWETQTSLQISHQHTDQVKLQNLINALRGSDRVKASVKEKTDLELLRHYLLVDQEWLTHLGILCIGTQTDRARLGTAPVIQFIKYDDQERKINKLVWDDYTQSPMELVDAVWREIPDFREFYEIPGGLFRQQVPMFDEIVVRELLINALVHRPYTQRGDIFINLHVDHLDIVNPGTLPLGVTPQNVLHETRRRNENLTRLFHDLKLMEREGSGYDTMYDVLLSQGRTVPVVTESGDSVCVTLKRSAPERHVMDFIAKASQAYPLTQRERIALGLLAMQEALTAREMSRQLELPDTHQLKLWLARLLNWGVVRQSGRTQATRYFIEPDMLRSLQFSASTSLKRIEPHRLQALVLEDLGRYPDSAIGEIHRRIGEEIHAKQLKRTLDKLIEAGQVVASGEKRGRRYAMTSQRLIGQARRNVQ